MVASLAASTVSPTCSPGPGCRPSGDTASTSPRPSDVDHQSHLLRGGAAGDHPAGQRAVRRRDQRRAAYGDRRRGRQPRGRAAAPAPPRPGGPGRSRGTARSPGRPGRATPRRSRPACTTRPARITASRSATVKASSWSWVTISAVVPAARRISRRSPASRSRSPASRAESGSSSRISRGSTASERASATRCRSPPDRVAGSRSPYPSRPTRASSSCDPLGRPAGRGCAGSAARSRRCGPP